MSQLWSNNVDTTLAATLSDVATSATLTDGSGLNSPTGGNFELLTLIAAGLVEVVKVTARSSNTITITRAQEGTTAQTWAAGTRVFAGVTAGTLEALLQNQATGLNSIALGASSSASGLSATAYGRGAWANNNQAIAVGYNAFADADDTLATRADVGFGAVGAMAVGETTVITSRTMQTAAVPAVPRSNGLEADAAWKQAGSASIICSAVLDLKTLQTYTITLPTGVTFFPEEVGVIVTAASGVTLQPSLRFGATADEARYLAITQTAADAVHGRDRYVSLASAAGSSTLRAEITTAATGTTLSGRVYWRGFAVVNAA